MKHHTKILFGTALLLLAGCGSLSHKVYRVNSESPLKRGIPYALPRTVITAAVPITKTEIKAGPFADLAEEVGVELPNLLKLHIDYLNKADSKDGRPTFTFEQAAASKDFEELISKFSPATEFALGETSIGTAAEPDPDQVFIVTTNTGLLRDVAMNLKLTEQGLLTEGDAEVTDKTIDFGMKVFSTATSLFGKAMKVAGPIGILNAQEPGSLSNARRAKAKKIKEDLDALRGKKSRLLEAVEWPQGNVDSIRIQLDELQKMENDLLGNFFSKRISTFTYRCEYRPESDVKNPAQTILYFSAKTGLSLQEECKHYSAVTSLPKAMTSGEKGTELKLYIRCTNYRGLSDTLSAVPSREEDGKNEHGFYYRVPGRALASLKLDSQELARSTVLVAQYGVVLSLPVDKTTSKSKFAVGFHVDQGSLKSVGFSQSGIDTNVVTEAGKNVESIMDTIATSRLKPAKPSAADQLKAKLEMLETQKKIWEIENPNTPWPGVETKQD